MGSSWSWAPSSRSGRRARRLAPVPPRPRASGDCLHSGSECLRLDIIIILSRTVSIAVVVGEPVVCRPRPAPADDPRAAVRAGFLLQQDTPYTARRDVGFDCQTGTVDQQDDVELRQRLERAAIQVLRLLGYE